MNLIQFTDLQRQALLDLAVLAMYADGHLAAAEDERVERLLAAMGSTSEYERRAQYDASVARVSRHSANIDAVIGHVRTLAQHFTTADHRRTVHEILRDLMASDDQVAPPESTYLSAVREALSVGSKTGAS